MFLPCIFFFVKQKTAYVWRISDWISDVCSSDLRRSRRRRVYVVCVVLRTARPPSAPGPPGLHIRLRPGNVVLREPDDARGALLFPQCLDGGVLLADLPGVLLLHPLQAGR